VQLVRFDRSDELAELDRRIAQSDLVVHLAGENRPRDPADFTAGNADLTAHVCEAIRRCGRQVPLIFFSSAQAELDNPYGRSKRAAEHCVEELSGAGNPAVIYRLPGVFGKWCKPDYNSVVATFCYNIARGLDIQITDPSIKLKLAYIDDVVEEIISNFGNFREGLRYADVEPVYTITLGELASQIEAFRNSRQNLVVERVGGGLIRALYATYVSYLPPSSFTYDLTQHADERGTFVEIVRTHDSGQFSFFTSLPSVTRGRHYHHSKSEKFLVVQGTAQFVFRDILTGARHQIVTSSSHPRIVESVPGWAHEITNIGEEEMVVFVWANENYDPDRSDTISSRV